VAPRADDNDCAFPYSGAPNANTTDPTIDASVGLDMAHLSSCS
jgi:hypothetical protein